MAEVHGDQRRILQDRRRRLKRRAAPVAVSLAAAVLVAGGVSVPAAQAAVDCRGAQAPTVVARGLGLLESVLSGRDGRLYFTSSLEGGRLMTLPRTGSAPRVVARLEAPGGLARAAGDVVVGSGNSIPGGATGNALPAARLVRVDPTTGKQREIAAGLTMANGIARGPDGAYYASDDVGLGIDRVRQGRVEVRWASTISGNGLAVSRDGRWLFAAQTFVPAAIRRIEIASPDNVTTFARAPEPTDIPAGLDGMTRDHHDRLFVAANGAGEVWRIDRGGRVCVVASGLSQPSAVAFGSGRHGFERRDLYVVEFSGRVVRLERARDARTP